MDEISRRIINTADINADEIIGIGEKILKNPELGYREEKTSALVREYLSTLQIEYRYPLAITGVKARLCGRKSLYNICIIGEMDALKCPQSPIASPDGTAHSCGHNAQMAAMLGAAMVLSKSGVMQYLDGDITFIAAPAEEFIDLEYRSQLKSCGRIAGFGGKQQLIYENAFSDTDMAVMLHAQPCEPNAKLYARGHNLGFMAKNITFLGKAAHGSTPYDGTNALNAAALAILGIHANRETFRDEDSIRIHPIITKGGEVVNSVPDEVCIETYIRGASFEAIKKGDKAVNRAICGAAQMIGAEVRYENIPGYLPISESAELSQVMEDCAAELIGRENIIYGEAIVGSTDIGDLSRIMPVIQPSFGGFSGALHSSDFAVADKQTAYVLPAKLLALTAAELLKNGAAKARNVKNSFTAKMTKDEYLNYLKGNED